MLSFSDQLLYYAMVWPVLTAFVAAALIVRRETRLMLRYLYARQVLSELVFLSESKLVAEFELESHDGEKTVLNAKLSDKSQIILTVYDNLAYSADSWNPGSLVPLQLRPVASKAKPGYRVK